MRNEILKLEHDPVLHTLKVYSTDNQASSILLLGDVTPYLTDTGIWDIDLVSIFDIYPNCALLYAPDTFLGVPITNGNTVVLISNIYYHSVESLLNFIGYVPPFVVSLPPSLNGNGAEFIDGTQVTVDGRSTLYIVNRSYMGLVQDNSYTPFYDLDALNGSKLTVPESLLTQYVASVIVP